MQEQNLYLKFDDYYNAELFAVQAETGRVYNIQILDTNNMPTDASGMALDFYIGNSKEVTKIRTEEVDASQGKFKVNLVNTQLKYAGLNKAQFELLKDDKKIASKIFDIYIEKSLSNGELNGQNVLVNFEEIAKAVELLKGQAATLEEAKEIDFKLKKGILSAEELQKLLAEERRLTDLKIKEGQEARTGIETAVDNASGLNKNLSDNIESASGLNDVLNEKITSGSSLSDDLNSKLESGNNLNTELKGSIEEAKTSNTRAEELNKNLKNTTNLADTTNSSLEANSIKAENLSEILSGYIENGNSLDDTLKAIIAEANSSNTNLSNTNKSANTSIDELKTLLAKSEESEQSLNKIIASGDLDQYVTDPKLEEILTSYATKEDLEKIDVTSQLIDYAKKDEIPKNLSELQEDNEHKTMTAAEKDKLANIEAGANKVTKLSQLENDKTFKTEAEIQELINNSKKLKKEIVESLPSSGQDDVIYLLKNKNDANNVYTEYLWIGGKWEIIGDTKVDLTDYAKKDEIPKLPDLSPFAKKEDIKTKLSEMTSDSENRLVSDIEKTKLSNLKEQVILTESEYEALSSAQKNDESKIYFLKE